MLRRVSVSFFLAIVLAASSSLSASVFGDQSPTRSAESRPLTIGPFEFEKDTIDLGKFRDTEKRSTEFRFKNATNRELKILDVKKTCGCTAAEASKKILGVGESGVLAVTYDGHMRQGKDTKVITIVTDDPTSPNANVTVHAEVVARIAIEPRAVFLGEFARRTAAKEKELKIISRKLDLLPAEPKVEDPRFTFEFVGATDEVESGDPVKVFRYKVGFKGGESIANERTAVTIPTNDAEQKILTVFVLANVIGPMLIVPSHQMQIVETTPGKAFTKDILIARRDGKPWNLVDVKLIDAPAELGLAIDRDAPDPRRPGWVSLHLRGKTPEKVGKNGFELSGAIKLTFDTPEEPEHILKLTGSIRF